MDRARSRVGGREFAPTPREGGRKQNPVTLEACGPLFKALGVDLTEIEVIDVATALVILAEIGVDVSRFPTEKHFASWLGASPRPNESNKRPKKRGPRKGRSRVATALWVPAHRVGTAGCRVAM